MMPVPHVSFATLLRHAACCLSPLTRILHISAPLDHVAPCPGTLRLLIYAHAMPQHMLI